MSYGNYNIWSDLQKGMSEKEVAGRLALRYSDIPMIQAMEIVKEINKKGPDAKIQSWNYKYVKVQSYERVK